MYGYTGLEYEYYSDLNYARARYYKAEIGRFLSEDSYLGDVLNPQTQNLYAYVHNNPLRYIDPSGHRVWLIHGTGSDPEKGWRQGSDEFVNYIEELFDDVHEMVDWSKWSGGNSTFTRANAADKWSTEIYNWHKANPDDPIRLIGHSHGGNVGVLIANELADMGMSVETFITIVILCQTCRHRLLPKFKII